MAGTSASFRVRGKRGASGPKRSSRCSATPCRALCCRALCCRALWSLEHKPLTAAVSGMERPQVALSELSRAIACYRMLPRAGARDGGNRPTGVGLSGLRASVAGSLCQQSHTYLVTVTDWSDLLFVQDLAAREAAGDVVGLSLRAHSGRVGGQVTRGRDQHVCSGRSTAQQSVLAKRCFDGLYGVEVTVLPKEQAAHHRQQPFGISSAIKVAGHELARRVHPLPFVQECREPGEQFLRCLFGDAGFGQARRRDVQEAVEVDAHRRIENSP